MTVLKPAAVPTAASNAAGSSGEGILILAGVVVAAAGWKKNHHLGEWWWKALIGTTGLAVLASMTNRTRVAPIVKGFAWITFISACIYAIPAFKNAAPLPPYKGSSPYGSPNPGGSPTEGAPRGKTVTPAPPAKGSQKPF